MTENAPPGPKPWRFRRWVIVAAVVALVSSYYLTLRLLRVADVEIQVSGQGCVENANLPSEKHLDDAAVVVRLKDVQGRLAGRHNLYERAEWIAFLFGLLLSLDSLAFLYSLVSSRAQEKPDPLVALIDTVRQERWFRGLVTFAGALLALSCFLYFRVHDEHESLEKAHQALGRCAVMADFRAQIYRLHEQNVALHVDNESLHKDNLELKDQLTALGVITGMSKEDLERYKTFLKQIMQRLDLGSTHKTVGEIFAIVESRMPTEIDCKNHLAKNTVVGYLCRLHELLQTGTSRRMGDVFTVLDQRVPSSFDCNHATGDDLAAILCRVHNATKVGSHQSLGELFGEFGNIPAKMLQAKVDCKAPGSGTLAELLCSRRGSQSEKVDCKSVTDGDDTVAGNICSLKKQIAEQPHPGGSPPPGAMAVETPSKK